jgi:hypothetical protein
MGWRSSWGATPSMPPRVSPAPRGLGSPGPRSCC